MFTTLHIGPEIFFCPVYKSRFVRLGLYALPTEMNASTIRPVLVLFAVTIVCTRWRFLRGASVVELDEIDVFVQSVLATADRTALGLPKPDGVRAPAARRRWHVTDGNLPADLQRYLERLVSVSSAVDGHRLVATVWDDDGTIVGDGDAEPHDVFDRYNGRAGVGRQTTATTTATTNKTSVDGKRTATSYRAVTVFE